MRIERSTCPALATQVLPFLADLDRYYPDFGQWYQNKVIPGVVAGQDSMVLVWDGEHLAGVALGKSDGVEAKLRCVRVAQPWQNTGVGLRLIERMFDELGTDKPLVTVSEEMLHQYSRPFINRYGFALTEVAKGRYRRGKLEYEFNGR